ncbi:MAG: hypothetical protein PHI89_00595 [Thiovulaceae bacterium]|jgi:hypothetical protein|nr:hypothetical protein [Sulfurimonadaceae bacterium]
MLQVIINNQPTEQYFKTPDAIKAFLESAADLDLLSIIKDIHADKLHQQSLEDIKKNNLKFHNDTKSLLDDLNA